MLAFWCGNVEEQIDRLFRSSGLMRDKWDRKTGTTTYGQITIRNAVLNSRAIYMPLNPGDLVMAGDEFSSLEGEEDPEEAAEFSADLSRITLTLEAMKPHTNPRYGREEIGIGNVFADYYRNIARYNGERGVWYVYDGKVWRPDIDALAVSELAKTLADRLYVFALKISDEDTRNRYIRRVQRLQLRKNRKTMIEDAKSVYPVRQKRFDQNRHLFYLLQPATREKKKKETGSQESISDLKNFRLDERMTIYKEFEGFFQVGKLPTERIFRHNSALCLWRGWVPRLPFEALLRCINLTK